MSPHTVTGVLTGCTFDSSSNRSQTISHSCFSSFSGRYLQSRAISTHLSRSVDIVCVYVCACAVMYVWTTVQSTRFTGCGGRNNWPTRNAVRAPVGCRLFARFSRNMYLRNLDGWLAIEWLVGLTQPRRERSGSSLVSRFLSLGYKFYCAAAFGPLLLWGSGN